MQLLNYGETIDLNGLKLSLHPAGHILGSAQVRLEYGGQVWVVSGDYKTGFDATCEPLESLTCHTFVTESTFGLSVFKWRPQEAIFADINRWWRENHEQGRTSILLAYGMRTPGHFGVGVRLSDDEGTTWTPPRMLVQLEDGTDVGYPSSVQLEDGTIVTAYYCSRIATHQRYHMGVVRWQAE